MMNDEGLDRVAARLESERPVPRPAFRGKLRRDLITSAERQPTKPPRLRLVIAAFAGSGTALLAIAAIGLSGIGPLAPG
jgi:hypothetical protein